jgi:hypothetical protein
MANNEAGSKRSSTIPINGDEKRIKTEEIFTEENIDKLLKEKNVTEIIELISKIKDFNLHTKVFHKVRSFLYDTENKKINNEKKFLVTGIIEIIIATMNNYISKGKCDIIVSNVCNIFINYANYANYEDNKLQIDNGIKAIINAIKVHITCTNIVDYVIIALDYLISIKNHIFVKNIINEGGLKFLIDIINTHKQNLPFLSKSFQTLLSLITHSNVFCDHIIHNIYDMITKNVIHSSLLSTVLPILLKLIIGSKEKNKYATLYHKLCNTMIKDKNEDIVYHLCVFLKNLSVFIPKQEENTAEEYINILLEIIKHNINNDKILSEAVLAIKNCIEINDSIKIYQSGILTVLLDVINKHTNNAILINNAFCLIYSLLDIKTKYKDEFDDRLLYFIACFGIKKVIEMMNISVVKNEPGKELNIMCKLMAILCNSKTIFTLIIELKGLKVLLEIIKKYIKHETVKIYLNTVMHIYCLPHSYRNRDVISFDDIKTIVEVMEEHINNNIIQCYGLEIMRIWTYQDIPSTGFKNIDFAYQQQIKDKKNHNFKTINNAGGFVAIITAMTKHKDDMLVQKYVLETLINYIKRIGNSAKKQVMEVFNLLIENINKHINNDEIIYNACNLLANLCENCNINKDPQIFINNEYQSIIKKEGIKLAIHMLETIIKKENNNNNIYSICHLLHNVTHNNNFDCNIKDLFDCDIINTILTVIKINKNNVKNLDAINFLRYLIRYNDGLKKFVMSGGISLIIDIMITHKNMHNLCLLIEIILKLSEVEEYLHIVLSQGIRSLITTMQEIVIIKDNKNILINVCRIINNFVTIKGIKDEIIRLNVPEWAIKIKQDKDQDKQEQDKQDQDKQEQDQDKQDLDQDKQDQDKQELTVLLDTLIQLKN